MSSRRRPCRRLTGRSCDSGSREEVDQEDSRGQKDHQRAGDHFVLAWDGHERQTEQMSCQRLRPADGSGAPTKMSGGETRMIVARSCYSFLRGTSSPAALVARASALKMKWLALADDDSLAGAVPFWKACVSAGLKPVLGARLGGRVHLIQNRAGYAHLCR